MKKLLLTLFCLFAIFTAKAQCDYILEMNDTYGDGWADNTVEVYVNGTLSFTGTFSDLNGTACGGWSGPDCSTKQVPFTVNQDDIITTVWVPDAGSYPGETSYKIINAEGTTEFDGAQIDSPPITVSCPSCSNATATISNITATGATATWDAATGAASYDWEVVPSGNAQGTGVVDSGSGETGLTVSIIGLTSNTEYDFLISSDCTTDYASAVSFSTNPACGETVTFCYDSGSNTLVKQTSAEVDSAGDYITATVNSGSTESGYDELVVYDSLDTSGTVLYDSSGDHTGQSFESTTGFISVWVRADSSVDCVSGSQSQISMTFTCAAPPSCPDPSALTASGETATSVDLNWTIGDSETLWDIELVDVTASGSATGTPTTEDVTTNLYTLSGLTPENDYQVYLRADCSGDNSETSDWIGPISFTTLVTCPVPSALTASGETATTVDLDWTIGDSETLWDIELVDVTASGSATGSPTTEDITTNPYTLSGLTSNNDYQVYLRADCGGGDTSDWVGPVSFTTLCVEISTFPSTTDFTLNAPTDCWSQAGDGTPSEGPTGTSSSWNAGRSFNGVPSNRVNLFSTGKEEWLISPTYAIPTGDAHELILTLAVTDYNSTSADADGMAGTDDEVQLLQTLDGGTTWTSLETWDSSNEPAYTGTAYTIDLTSVAGLSVQFALWATEGSVNDLNDYDFHVGGFTVRETPSCLDVTGLAIGNIVADTAEVSWTDSNPTPAGLYQYELVDVTAGDVVLTTDTTASSPLSLTGLTTLNEYKIRVRANCGSAFFPSYSAWSSYVSWTQVEAPGCPTNLTPIDGATDQDWRSVTLSWDAPTTGGAATSYSVLYGTTEAGMFEVATTTETSYTINGLNSDATVFIGVNAVNAGGTSSSCTANSITTNAVGLACDTPVEAFEGTNTEDILSLGSSTAFYTYTATTAGSLTIDSCGQGVDTYLQTLDDGCAAVTGTYDDGCSSGYGSTYTVDVLPNDVINFRWVAYWFGSDVEFDFDITLTPTCSGTTTTWDGTAWSNGAPDANSYAIMSGAYSTGTDGAITACVLQADASVTIDGATDAAIGEVLVMAGNTLTIDETSSLTVSGDFTNTGTVTLNSTADDFSSLIVTGTATGDITYNRYVNVYDDTAGGGWDLVCSPVDMTIADFITANGANIQVLGDDYAFSQFNNETGQWERYETASQTGSFTTGQGYSMATSAGATVAFTGTMETTSQSINIINNNGLNGVGRRWNLVSNPFPSYINGNTAAGASNFMDANAAVIDSEFLAVYGWNGSSYDIYNNLSGAFSMAPGQGFWVAATNTTDTALSFTADMRTTSGSGDFVAGPHILTYHVALELYNGETQKATTEFYFRDGLSLDLDPGYDAAAFNQSTKLSSRLAGESQETAFARNAMGMDAMQNTRVPLEIRQNTGQAFTISIADMNLPEDIYVYLEDTVNGTLTSLKEGDFELEAQSDLSGADRFFIVFKSNSVLSSGDTLGLEALNVYKANNDSFVTIAGITPELEKLDVTLYSILGAAVKQTILNTTTATQRFSTQGLASGLYIVQIKSGNQTTVKKVIIK